MRTKTCTGQLQGAISLIQSMSNIFGALVCGTSFAFSVSEDAAFYFPGMLHWHCTNTALSLQSEAAKNSLQSYF